MDTARTIRNIANVINLSTPLGLVLLAVGRGRLRRHRHLIVADNVSLPVPAGAMTVGCVVLVFRKSLEEAEQGNPTLMAHEEEHAWQWAYCLGLPFLPLYLAASAWSLFRTGDRAAANHFERQAGLAAGGYREMPRLPLREALARLRRA